MKKRTLKTMGITTLMIMSLAVAGSINCAAEGQADKIVYALDSSSFDMSPFATNSVPRQWMLQNCYASLYCMDYYGQTLEEMEPWLAKSYEKIDDLTYRITLFDYIHDSKGNQITSEDIVYSYEQMLAYGETRIGSYLDNIEIEDDYNMIFHLKKYGPGVMEFLLGNYTLGIADKEWYENASDEEKANDPAVTGAYQIVDYVPGSSITMEAIEDYWQTDDAYRTEADVQNVKTIEYTVITETSMRSIALENKEIDGTVVNASELSRFYSEGEALEGYNVDIEDGCFGYTVFLNMDENSNSPLATDENLRKAALYALDSESILYGGDYDETTATIIYSLGTPAMAGYDESWGEDYWNYNVDTAKEYYAASGHSEGDVTIRLLSRTSIPDGMHSVMIANLEAVGFKVELLSYDQSLFNTYKVDSTAWDMILDNKGATGNIVSGWDNNFNPAGYTNGSVCFTHDDQLVELLNTATTTGSEEDINAFHEYLKSLACQKGLFTANNLMVAQDGITAQNANGNNLPRVNAFEFADDYVSAGN